MVAGVEAVIESVCPGSGPGKIQDVKRYQAWWAYGLLLLALPACSQSDVELWGVVLERAFRAVMMLFFGVVALVTLDIALLVLLFMAAGRLERAEPSLRWGAAAMLGAVLEGAQAAVVIASAGLPKWLAVPFLLLAAGFAHAAWQHVAGARSR